MRHQNPCTPRKTGGAMIALLTLIAGAPASASCPPEHAAGRAPAHDVLAFFAPGGPAQGERHAPARHARPARARVIEHAAPAAPGADDCCDCSCAHCGGGAPRADAGAERRVIIVGPDGQRREMGIGEGRGGDESIEVHVAPRGRGRGEAIPGAPHRAERRVEIRRDRDAGPGGHPDAAVEVRGKVIIVGPDGQRRELEFGGPGAGAPGPEREIRVQPRRARPAPERAPRGDARDTIEGTIRESIDQAMRGMHGFGIDPGDFDVLFDFDWEGFDGDASWFEAPDADFDWTWEFVPSDGQAAPHGTPIAPGAHAAGVLLDPVGLPGVSPQGERIQSHSVTTMMKSDGTDTYEVRIEDGRLSAKVNGKELPPNRIRRRGSTVELLDESGGVAASFQVSGPGGTVTLHGSGRAQVGEGFVPEDAPAARDDGAGGGVAQVAEPPKAMLGVTLAEPDAAVAEHLGLEPGSATLISGVIEDLPAAKAGLKVSDIIVAIDGERPAGPEQVRAALREKNPGDTVELTILRRGRESTVKATLEAYDPERLGLGEGAWTMSVPLEGVPFGGADADEARRLAEEFQKRAEELTQRFARRRGPGGDPEIMLFGPEGGRMFAVPPGNERFEDINRRIDEIQRQLDEIKRMVESLLERQGGR